MNGRGDGSPGVFDTGEFAEALSRTRRRAVRRTYGDGRFRVGSCPNLVAMDEPERLSRGQSITLDGEIEERRKVVGGGDRRAVDKLHHQIIRADIVERADIGVVERSHRPRFTFKPRGEPFIGQP